MANQLIPAGTLNRLLTSIKVISNPGLNITRGYFANRMATITFEGQATDYIDAQTGGVQSPRPYQSTSVLAYLLKSQPLSQSWESQRLTSTSIGDVVVTTDSPVLGPYYLSNCVLMNVNELNLSGTDDDFPLSCAARIGEQRAVWIATTPIGQGEGRRMTVTIDRALNLVVPLQRGDGMIYVHATPVAYEIFEKYHLVMSKTFASLFREGLSIAAGPRVAWMMLRDIAQDTARGTGLSWWEGDDGVEHGLMAEIKRLSNVIAPLPAGGGWDTQPLQDALDAGYLDKEDAGEVLNQLAFFTVVSRVPQREDREKFVLGGARTSNSQTTSFNATEFAASLKTSTKAAPTGAKAATPAAPRSSVPS